MKQQGLMIYPKLKDSLSESMIIILIPNISR